jgi:phosphopantetheinyl transferase (holo-ACP synthase)
MVDNPRFGDLIFRHPGLLEDLFTPAEQVSCGVFADSPALYAGCFAVKEAYSSAWVILTSGMDGA